MAGCRSARSARSRWPTRRPQPASTSPQSLRRPTQSVERARATAKASDTIEPLLPDFIAYLRRNGRAESYLADTERSLHRYFRPLHGFAAADINRAMVAKELATIRTERGPFAANRARAHLSKFFSWAIAEGLAEANPVSGTAKTATKPRDRVLRDAELAAIWDELADGDYDDIVRLLILTGARRDEIGALRRGEINLAQRQIELARQPDQERPRSHHPAVAARAGDLAGAAAARGPRLRLRARRGRLLRVVAVQGAARCKARS